jgi:hypothetical protein
MNLLNMVGHNIMGNLIGHYIIMYACKDKERKKNIERNVYKYVLYVVIITTIFI